MLFPRIMPLAAACALACALSFPAAAATFSVGPGGDFPTITAALAAPQSEASVFELTPGYTSTGETLPIDLFGAHPITVRPQLGATGLVVSGSVTPVILGFGGGFVVDGRPGGVGTSRELTIRCTATNMPAVQFTEGSRDTLRWVNVESANASATSGAVYFAPNQLGCAFDHVSACRIGGGGLVPTNLVYFPAGNVSSRVRDTAVEDCELRDWFGSASVTAAIFVQTESRDLAFRRNSFYQTAARNFATTGRTQYAILVNGPTPNLAIEDNWFGGSAPQCAGTPWTLTGSGGFTLVSLTADNAAPAIVRGNVVRHFDVTVGGTARILSLAGHARCENNAIGDTLAAGRIAIHAGAGATTIVSHTLADQSVIRDNRIAGVSHTASSGSFTVLNVTASSTAVTIANNRIGGSLAGEISTSSAGQCAGLVLGGFAPVASRVDSNEVSYLSRVAASSAQSMYGMHVSDVTTSLTGNGVARLSDAAVTSAPAGKPTLAGISVAYSSSTWLRLARNTVHSLAATAATSATRVCGVSVDMATEPDAVLDANFVHSLESASADTGAFVTGVRVVSAAASGAVTVSNNMVRVGIGPGAATATNGGHCVALASRGAVTWVGNSAFVGAVFGATGTVRSSAFDVETDANGPVLRDNILQNDRGGIYANGRHSALFVESLPLAGFSSDANLVFVRARAGANPVLVLADGTVYSTLAAWQASGRDGASIAWNPEFRDPLGDASHVDLHIDVFSDLLPAAANSGLVWLGWNTDFDGQVRAASHPDIGADEFPDFGGLGAGDRAAPVALAPARPNPVRGACTFEFALDRAGAARLEVFDASGRRVRTLVHGTLEPGVHSVRWDRTDDDGGAVRPGTYFVRLAGPLGRESRRVIVLD